MYNFFYLPLPVPDDVVVHWGVTSVFNNKDFSDQLQVYIYLCSCVPFSVLFFIGCCLRNPLEYFRTE